MSLTPDNETDTAAGLLLDDGLWLSISKLAELKGVTKQTISERVRKLERDQLIKTRPGKGKSKLINVAEYDRALGETSDLSKHQGARTKEKLSSAGPVEDEARGSSAFAKQQTLRAGYDAEMKRLDLEERIGNIVSAKDVENRTFTIFRKVRDRLLSIPSISAPRLANAVDERAARVILDEDIRKVLDAMAHDLDNPGDDDLLAIDDDDEADGLASTMAPVQEASAAVAAAAALRSDEPRSIPDGEEF